jgi:DNA-binding response OmpR family regulator
LSTRLQCEGYTFLFAGDGEETLCMLREHKPDLLLLDLNMPKKDGFEVLAEMRADPELALIPVIIITAARIGPRDVREGLNLGADDYVIKPFDWRELAARIQSRLRVKFAEDGLRRRANELTVLSEISQALSDAQDLEGVMSAVLQRSAEAFQAEGARMDVLISDDQVRSRRYWLEEERLTGCDTEPQEARAWGVNAFIFENACPAVVLDIPTDPRWRSGRSSRHASAMAAPLISRGRVLGTLTMMHSQAAYFTEEQSALLLAAAGLAALAIENTMLYGRLELAADLLRTPLMAALGYSELLVHVEGLDPQAAEFIHQLQSAALQMKEQVWRLMHAAQTHSYL